MASFVRIIIRKNGDLIRIAIVSVIVSTLITIIIGENYNIINKNYVITYVTVGSIEAGET